MPFARGLLALALLFLAGCATDRPLAIACRDFARFRIPVEPALATGGQGDVAPGAEDAGEPLSPLAQVFASRLEGDAVTAAQPGERHFLVLSGGGQWGAFG